MKCKVTKVKVCSGSLECYMREKERCFCPTAPFPSYLLKSALDAAIVRVVLHTSNSLFVSYRVILISAHFTKFTHRVCSFPTIRRGRNTLIANRLDLTLCLAIVVGRALRNLATDGSSPPSRPGWWLWGGGWRGFVGAALCGARLSYLWQTNTM